jgi:site-specific DNA-methyltransferase (adenine-specific)
MNSPLFFGSAGDERATPQDFFDTLNAEFHFDIDCAATDLNRKCPLWFGKSGKALNALEEDWNGMTCFLNPPYSQAGAFIAKAREEADKGATVVFLLPVRSDTKYWHQYIWDKDAWRRVKAATANELWNTFPDPCLHDGDWRPGVRCRLLPGRLNFELKVPKTVREWIISEFNSHAGSPTLSGLSSDSLHLWGRPLPAHARQLIAATQWLKDMVIATGLPKMAIERILQDVPDADLLDAAPFPSCVVIFTAE